MTEGRESTETRGYISHVKMPQDKREVFFLFILLTVALFRSLSALRVDRTVVDGATGSNVVRASIAKLRAANLLKGIGPNCKRSFYRFLREIAYVESKDGTVHVNSSPEQLNGGIWRVNMTRFEETIWDSAFDYITYHWPTISLGEGAFTNPFYINNTNPTERGLGLPVMWRTVQYQNLSKPLYSATAALLSLLYIQVRLSSRMLMINGINRFQCRAVDSRRIRARVWSAAYTSSQKNATFFRSELHDLNGE